MLINGTNFTIGADPEVFSKLGDDFVSAHDLIPGTKEEPFAVEKGAVQVDGMALEFNIDPADNYDEFEDNLLTVMGQLSDMIGEHELMEQCSVMFDQQLYDSVPVFNKALGCQPDFDAWNKSVNHPPQAKTLMRTAGGHVHVGGFFTEDPMSGPHMSESARMARLMDEEIGVYSILWDKDDKRREMYGKAGCFRPKPFGMEYRTMSNKWIHNKGTMKFVFDGVVRALNRWTSGEDGNPDVQTIINTSDRSNIMFKGNPLAEKAASLG